MLSLCKKKKLGWNRTGAENSLQILLYRSYESVNQTFNFFPKSADLKTTERTRCPYLVKSVLLDCVKNWLQWILISLILKLKRKRKENQAYLSRRKRKEKKKKISGTKTKWIKNGTQRKKWSTMNGKVNSKKKKYEARIDGIKQWYRNKNMFYNFIIEHLGSVLTFLNEYFTVNFACAGWCMYAYVTPYIHPNMSNCDHTDFRWQALWVLNWKLSVNFTNLLCSNHKTFASCEYWLVTMNKTIEYLEF